MFLFTVSRCVRFRFYFLYVPWINGIAKVFEGIAVPEKGTNEPEKQHCWNGNGHHKVLDLMTQVHEFRDNIECLGGGENDIKDVEPDLGMVWEGGAINMPTISSRQVMTSRIQKVRQIAFLLSP